MQLEKTRVRDRLISTCEIHIFTSENSILRSIYRADYIRCFVFHIDVHLISE